MQALSQLGTVVLLFTTVHEAARISARQVCARLAL
jgi:hypothetical protein